MKVAFAHDHVFYVDENFKFYTNGDFSYRIWERYLKVFREVVVISRFKNIDDTINIKKLSLSSGKNVKFAPVININNLKGILKRQKVKKAIADTLRDCDALIARLPSEIGLLAINVAKQLNIPYAIELAGEPFSALWYHGSFVGKVYAPILSYRVKRTIKDCNFVLYVTKEYLQRKYPTNGYTESCSNVEINAQLVDVLHNRPPCRKKFGTIGRMKTNIVEISPCSWGHEVDVSMVRKSPKDRRTPVAWCTTECRSRVGKHAG